MSKKRVVLIVLSVAVLAALVFLYSSTLYADKVAPPMRGVMPTRTADLITRMFGVGASMIGWTGHEDGESAESR